MAEGNNECKTGEWVVTGANGNNRFQEQCMADIRALGTRGRKGGRAETHMGTEHENTRSSNTPTYTINADMKLCGSTRFSQNEEFRSRLLKMRCRCLHNIWESLRMMSFYFLF